MANSSNPNENPEQSFLMYATDDGVIHVNVRVDDETVWLTQGAMAELFDCTPENVIQHLSNIYDSEELEQTATTKDFLVVRQEGTRQVTRKLKHYNLDTILA